jgi:indole-3-glycerol phosphate synthase
MATYLDEILAFHRARAAADSRTEGDLAAQVALAGRPRGFTAALAAAPGVGVIAEVKRRSPSKGPLAPNLDPAELARAYERGGATCVSVLTDGPHFGGSSADLGAAREAVALPVLRKDFTVDRRDLFDARLMGADAVLLIVAALSDDELAEFVVLGGDLGLDCLVEVHDEAELARALGAGASLVGVNQRDLRSFAVDPDRACRVAAAMPDGIVRVAESGIRSAEDVARLVDAGFDAILVGEALVTSADPAAALRSLAGTAAARR